MAAPTSKIPFDPATADLETARQIVFVRLRADRQYTHIDKTGEGFDPFVEYLGNPPGRDGRWRLTVLAQEVFWQLVTEGVLSPGIDYSSPDLPWFHITEYGCKVLSSVEPQPYDPTGYLARLREKIVSPDATVMAYLAESLETFRKGNLVASTVMLGIAAERVFLLLCESLLNSLADATEKKNFANVLDHFPMKPKLDWVNGKIERVQNKRLPGVPENAPIMLVAMYDLMRAQRNNLGHPREVPPQVRRVDAFANLQLFSPYYATAEEVRAFLAATAL